MKNITVLIPGSARVVDGCLFPECVFVSYNPLERREASKGGKDGSKKSASSQPSSKAAAAATKHNSHNARRGDPSHGSTTNQTVKVSRPSSSGGSSASSDVERSAYEQTVLVEVRLIGSAFASRMLRVVLIRLCECR